MSPLKIFSTFSICMQKEPDSTPHTRNEQDEVLDASSVTGKEQQVGKTCVPDTAPPQGEQEKTAYL